MVEIEEVSADNNNNNEPPTTTTTTNNDSSASVDGNILPGADDEIVQDADGWQRLMGEDLVMKVRVIILMMIIMMTIVTSLVL